MRVEKFFTAPEQERIQKAVIAAEKKTSGEFVPMIVSASGRYAEVELSGLVIGLVLGTLVAFVWHDPWGTVQTYLLWPVVGAILGFIILSIPCVKRRLISKDRITDAVHTRSLAAFTGHGLHYTRAHTGILIFVPLLEHRVVVLADRGINEKVAAGTWKEIVDTITEGLKSGNGCDGFCKAIDRCGEILAQHFPRRPDDQDELPNKLVTENCLESGRAKWSPTRRPVAASETPVGRNPKQEPPALAGGSSRRVEHRSANSRITEGASWQDERLLPNRDQSSFGIPAANQLPPPLTIKRVELSQGLGGVGVRMSSIWKSPSASSGTRPES